MRFIAIAAALTAFACAGVADYHDGRLTIVSEWFRSGCYIVGSDGIAMDTNPMSPVLGGAVIGGAAAGGVGAAAGGAAGLAEKMLSVFQGDYRVYGCDLLVQEYETGQVVD